jgi:hypothetical protein
MWQGQQRGAMHACLSRTNGSSATLFEYRRDLEMHYSAQKQLLVAIARKDPQ